jgi:hypothetical protein
MVSTKVTRSMNKLPLETRLQILSMLCEGVQHALGFAALERREEASANSTETVEFTARDPGASLN